jgi:FdhD protein
MMELENGRQNALFETSIVRFHQGSGYPADDVVAREEPLEIRLNGMTLVYLMRLPGDDVLLAAGFCLSEGLISSWSQVNLISHCSEGDGPGEQDPPAGDESEQSSGAGLVEITADGVGDAGRFDAARVVRTGCGAADLDRELMLSGVSVESDTRFSAGVITRVPDLLLSGQYVFRETGGTHGAGLFDSTGEMIVVKEDVGRHNAVDKVLGHLLMSGTSPDDKGLILSGRLSYEMVLKAARAGIPLVCSVSAPTALGVEMGREAGVTLVGFLRGESFNVYTHPERIGGA